MGSLRQFLIYACVGVINTAVHFAVFILLLRVFGVPVLAASTVGYAAGVANSYFMNRLWTFAVTTRVNGVEFGKFVTVNLHAPKKSCADLHARQNPLNHRGSHGQLNQSHPPRRDGSIVRRFG